MLAGCNDHHTPSARNAQQFGMCDAQRCEPSFLELYHHQTICAGVRFVHVYECVVVFFYFVSFLFDGCCCCAKR